MRTYIEGNSLTEIRVCQSRNFTLRGSVKVLGVLHRNCTSRIKKKLASLCLDGCEVELLLANHCVLS